MPQSPEFEQLERDPLHERVYRQLRSAIIAAKFEPGQKLTVRMIATAFGTSTMPVRAALARLSAEKAVTTSANGTIIIPALTREQFLELVNLRLMLEAAATEKAARTVTGPELDRLAQIATELSEAAENNQADRYIQANQAFKFAIFEAARSPALFDLIERVWLQVGPFLRYYAKDVRSQIDTDEHHGVIDALARRDGLAARAAIERDISGGTRYLLETVEFVPSPTESSPLATRG